MAAKKVVKETDEIEGFQCYTLDQTEKITTYDRKTLEKFIREGALQTRKLNNGKRVTTRKWIKAFLDSISDEGPLEF